MNFSNLFKTVRKQTNMTQTDMANRLGVSQGFLSRLENRHMNNPGAEIFLRCLRLANKNKEASKTVRRFLNQAVN